MAFFGLFGDEEEETKAKSKRATEADVEFAEDMDAESDTEFAEEQPVAIAKGDVDVEGDVEKAELSDTDMLDDDTEFGDETEVAVAATVDACDDATIRLKAEELDVIKSKMQTGEVILHKDIVEERKTVDVPVTHEQVVIERKVIHREPTAERIGEEETIHIPVSAEKVAVSKHAVVVGEVSAHKREITETESVSETLRREEVHVDATGDTTVIDDIALTSRQAD